MTPSAATTPTTSTTSTTTPERPFAECRRCVFTTAWDPKLVVDSEGICNHCRRYETLVPTRVQITHERPEEALWPLVKRIRERGRKSAYDCLIGVSGGTDSSYLAMLVRELGLRPLAVHLDNGWDSELAVDNIARLLRELDIDLITHVIDWDEFRDLQLSFLKASTPDGEVPSDHAIFALMWRQAVAWRIPFIISGMNFTTEAFANPDWGYGHSDWTYINDVHRRFGTVPLTTYPHFTFRYLAYVHGVHRVKTVSMLNSIAYNKADVKRRLEANGWRDYGGKHYESIYTRFYQGYVLPRKFGIDKRVGHICDLINAGQMTREEGVAELELPPYPEVLQRSDLEYCTKKLGLTMEEFDAIMALPVRSYRDYRNLASRVDVLKQGVNWARGKGLYPT